ncbi:hypothetical protein TNCV_4953611 [Trichonephila clavipes]|nr:hypothetical protein TNCV_4953611 [Trichonephila clavipes]
MLKSRISLYVFDAGTVNSQRCRDEILEIYELKVSLLEKWALLPKILIDTLINSMAPSSEAYIAVHTEVTSVLDRVFRESHFFPGLVWELVALSKLARPDKVETCPDTGNYKYARPEESCL